MKKQQDHQRKLRDVTPADESELNMAMAAARNGIKTASLDFINANERPLRVERNFLSGECTVNWNHQNHTSNKTAHLIRDLVIGVGLGEEDARKIASEVNEGKKVECTVKTAFTGHIDLPWPDVNDDAGATAYSNTPQVQPIQVQQTATVEEYDHKDPYDPETADFGRIMQEMSGGSNDEVAAVLERASQSGVKQVFDPAMVAMLLRTNRVQLQVESDYLPLLERSVDRMCRLLLLFYWHNSEFSETYGQDELAEFEDVLLTSIKTVGQLTLFLRQKSVGSTSAGIDAFSEAV